MLISSIVGQSSRTTVDLDTTLINFPATLESIEQVIEEILINNYEDLIKFTLLKIDNIREEDEYNGFRVSIECRFDTIKLILKMDITVGCPITPEALIYNYKFMFENKSIKIMSYPIETILAEKFETIISRSTENTRMRDFYDVYMLLKLKENEIDKKILKDAIINTSKSRGTEKLIKKSYSIIEYILLSSNIQNLWDSYTNKFNYAKDITFNEVMNSVIKIYEIIK